MEEEVKRIVKVEREFVGRVPYEYEMTPDVRTLEADSGFGRAGAKLDPKTGALKYDKFQDRMYEETLRKAKAKPKPKPEPVETGVAFSKDSRAMVHIKEEEDTVLDPNGELRGHRATGIISVVNLSDKDRIWDVGVRFTDKKNLGMLDYETISATELDPSQRKSKEYRIDVETPSIMITESISTHPEYINSLIVPKGKSSIVKSQLRVKNQAALPYRDLVIKKIIPPRLKNISFPDKGAADAIIEGDRIIWKLKDLERGASAVLKYECELEPEGTEEVPTGIVELDAVGTDTLTSFLITNFDAMCRNMYFIDCDETEELGVWSCRFVCDNSSSFEVEILKVEVIDAMDSSVYLNVNEPHIRVPPGKQWLSQGWTVRSEGRPKFVKNFIINVIPGLEKDIYYRLKKESANFYVAGLNFVKSFNKNQVEGKRNTDIEAKLEIENTGSALLDQIFIRDIIPRHMMPPNPESITVMRGGVPIKSDIRVSYEPEDENPAMEQKMFIHIPDLVDNGGPLRKGEKVIVIYRTPLIRPEPDSKIIAPAEVEAKPELPGPVVTGADVAGAPTINVLQILRKFSIGKSIVQGSKTGEYHVGLLYKNRGNRPIENLIIMDNVPRNFTGAGFTIEPSDSSRNAEGATVLKWTIPQIGEGETVGITYVIKGTGEYHPKDAQVFYNTPSD
jgi:hypothetical protein